MASPLAEAHVEAQGRLRDSVAQMVESVWDALPDHDESSVGLFADTVVPLVEAGQRRTVQLVDGYMAREMDRFPMGLDAKPLVGAAARGGTDPYEVYRRPFVTLWSELKEGKMWADAEAAARLRLQIIVLTDMQLSQVRAGAEVSERDPDINSLIRVVRGTCAKCEEAASEATPAGGLQPIHPSCQCSFMPSPQEAKKLPHVDEIAKARAAGKSWEQVAKEFGLPSRRQINRMRELLKSEGYDSYGKRVAAQVKTERVRKGKDPTEIVDQIAEARRAGKTYSEIRQEFGLTGRQNLPKLLQDNGYDVFGKRAETIAQQVRTGKVAGQENVEAMAEARQAGKSVAEVAREFGIRRGILLDKLKRAGFDSYGKRVRTPQQVRAQQAEDAIKARAERIARQTEAQQPGVERYFAERPSGVRIEGDPAGWEDVGFGVRDSLNDYYKIPQNVRDAIDEYRTRKPSLVLSEGKLTDIEDFAYLKGKQPRGWGEGSEWDEVGGVYSPQNMTAAVAKGGRSGSVNTVAHELGHLIDAAIRSDLTEVDRFAFHEVMDSFHRQFFDRLIPYLQQGGPGAEAGMSEFFAETTAEVYTWSAERFVRVYSAEYRNWLLEQLDGFANS